MHSLFTAILPYITSPISWIALIGGACLGSFLNVCIYRIPKGIFWRDSRSRCPHCGAPMPLWHNIPVFSWILLRGKAACCGNKISPQYPLVELFSAVSMVFIYWTFPFVIDLPSFQFDSAETLRFFHASIFFSLLLVCSVIDIHLQIIPDVLSLPMVAATPLIIFFHPELDWKSGLYGVIFGGGVLYAVAITYYFVRKEVGLGMGDVKLLAGIGGWLGYQSLLPTLFIASVTGAVFGIALMLITRSVNLKLKVPFGPFLAAGAMLFLLYGQQINEFLFYTE
ncbi:MAG: prepilin peptidase [Pseudobacteriovorax sp.]|nr:prepilin peptidase [Pseudobacteriovorax sp.]